MKKLIIFIYLFIAGVGISNLSAAESTSQFIQGTDTLVVYKDVPGISPSDKYTIRVRSAATNNEWVDVFVNVTNNRAVPGSTTEINSPDKYQMNCAGWSHAYGNIEMNIGQVVEVEIAGKPGFTIAGKDFFKAKVHPSQKASEATMVGNKIYFTLTKPAQIYIDINGQMDDYNRAINPIGHPVAVVMLFANPVIKKPTLTGTGVRTIEPGTDLATINAIDPATYDTMYFKPGLHDLAAGIKMYPGKTVYIPGDAYIFGAFNNHGVPAGSFSKNGEKITVFGYGTICGAKMPHYQVDDATRALLYPNVVASGKPIEIENGLYFKLQGVTLADNANHSVEINGSFSSSKWVKTISWRVNGDGLGSNFEDCFVRAHDDAAYTRGYIRRCTFWKDSNAQLFLMSFIPEDRGSITEDCDVLYARLRTNPGNNGAGFTHHATGTLGQRKVNAVFRNIRIHDKLANMRFFHLESGVDGGSYNGLIFQNISFAGIAPGQRINTIKGTAVSPWYGGVTFDNVTFGGTLLTDQNFSSFFQTNEFVKDIAIKVPGDESIFHNISVNASTGGSVSGGGAFNLKSYTTVTATPAENYGFVNWTENGVPVSSSKSYSFMVTKDRSLVANFVEFSLLTNIIAPTGWVAGTTNNKVDGNSRLMVVMATGENAAAKFKATSITYGEQPMTLQVDTCYENGARTYVGIFTLNEAGIQAATSGTIAVNWSETPSAGTDIQSVLLDNVDQTTPVVAVAKEGKYAFTISTPAISTALGNVIIMCGANFNSSVITFNNSFIKRLESNSSWGDAVCGEKIVVSASETPSFKQQFSGRAALCAIAVKQSASTSVNNLASTINLTIYPNPATDKLYFNSTDKLISKIELIDLTGKIVYAANVQVQNGSIDLKGIAKGMYLVKIHADKSITTKKISVN